MNFTKQNDNNPKIPTFFWLSAFPHEVQTDNQIWLKLLFLDNPPQNNDLFCKTFDASMTCVSLLENTKAKMSH